jgi:tetratricopeptide (TPR) repeat protein
VSEHKKIELNPQTAQDWFEAAVLVFRSKDAKTALNLMAKAISIESEISDYHAFLGIIFKQLQHHEQAEKAFQKAIQLDAKNTEAHYNLGNLYIELGHAQKAEECFRNVLKIYPEHASALHAMGLIHLQNSNYKQAESHFKRCLEIKKDFSKALISFGDLYQYIHQPKRALGWYSKFCQQEKATIPVQLKQAKCYLALGNTEACEQLCHAIILKHENHAMANALLGQCYQQQGKYQEAHQAFEKFKQEEIKKNATQHYSLGMVHFEQTRNLTLARENFDKALKLSPNYLAALLQLAHIDIIEGHLDAASDRLNLVLEISPEHPHALRQLAHIKKTEPFDKSNVDELEAKLASLDKDDNLHIDLRFALADHLDQKDEHDRAFEHLIQANQLSAKKNPFQLQHITEQVKNTIDYFSKETIEKLREIGSASQCPVFILGMPRSGTTLAEQILSSHPGIFGAGELPEISRIRYRIQNLTQKNFPECMNHVEPEQLNEIAENHVQYLNQLAPEATRVIDKMPFNYYYIGLILSLFPNAKIIHSIRNPLDTCLSCYFLKFSSKLSFTYNMEHLGEIYKLHDEIMQHWKSMFPEQIYTLSYEKLVESPKEETQKLLDFIELDWHDNCLMHHENQRPVKTASNWQVRQPIYTTSVDRWKNYQKHLHPIAEILNLDLN